MEAALNIENVCVGEIRLLAFRGVPDGFRLCDGAELETIQYPGLEMVLRDRFGKASGLTFRLPNLCGRLPIGAGQGPGLSERLVGAVGGERKVELTGQHLPAHSHGFYASRSEADQAAPDATRGLGTLSSQVKMYLPVQAGSTSYTLDVTTIGGVADVRPPVHDNIMPTIPLNYVIATEGLMPFAVDPYAEVSDPLQWVATSILERSAFLGEVRFFATTNLPMDWLPCNGRIVLIRNFPSLYALLGNTFGGNRDEGTFALPDLRGLAIEGFADATVAPFGKPYGSSSIALTEAEIADHSHIVKGIAGANAVQKTSSPGANNMISAISVRQGGSYKAAAMFNKPTHDVHQLTQLSADTIGMAGGNESGRADPHDNMQPYLALTAGISLMGEFPF